MISGGRHITRSASTHPVGAGRTSCAAAHGRYVNRRAEGLMEDANLRQRIPDLAVLLCATVIHFQLLEHFLENPSFTLIWLPLLFAWLIYLALSYIFESEAIIDGLNDEYSFIDTCFTAGPGLAILVTVWAGAYVASTFT
jgi:hypothetical protein